MAVHSRTPSLLALLSVLSGCGPRQPAPAAGKVREDPHGIVQVWVPAGSFLMGTDSTTEMDLLALRPPAWALKELPSEEPQHRVRISVGFWIDRTEVTNRAFQAFVDAGGYDDRALWSDSGWAWRQRQPSGALPVNCVEPVPDRPRVCVTWYEAEAYARWRGGRLPSEAEWEYAARGPQGRRYPWGESWDSTRCNVVGSPGPAAVGSYPAGASWVGAVDMAGNAMEWVADWLDVGYYRTSPVADPAGPTTGRIKVEKGGWWGSNAFVARSAYRHFEDPPTYQDHHIGFRVVTGGGVVVGR
jgi:formylglycine-generating enzyme required for sulfatase activity